MEQTFDEICEMVQDAAQDESTDTTAFIKRHVNVGAAKLAGSLTRYYTSLQKYASLVANQQDYQIPKSVIRPTVISVLSGENYKPLEEVNDEWTWSELNGSNSSSSSEPSHFFIRGRDLISLYPTPSTAVSAGLRVSYEPRQPYMRASDYSTGTLTLTAGSQTVTGASTVFTENMIGRVLKVTDGTDDVAYRVASFTSSTSITLDNYYEGISGSGITYNIGESPIIPGEYHDTIADYASWKYMLLKRGEVGLAKEFKELFQDGLDRMKQEYSTKTSSHIITPRRTNSRFGSPLYRLPEASSGY